MKVLFTILFILSSSQLLAKISYDFHYHFSDSSLFMVIPEAKTRAFILKHQNSAEVEKTMLISDSYRKPFLSSRDERYQLQQELEDFLLTNNDRMLGICSVNIDWPDVIEFATKCTQSELIKGVKLHFQYTKQSLQDPKFKARFIGVLEVLKDIPLFYLIHINFDHNPLAEAQELFSIASQYQKQNFIIAHGAEEHINVLSMLGERFSENPSLRKNIYTELSTTFTVASFYADHPQQVIKAWRKFGMSNILFGSDFPVSSATDVLKKLKQSGLHDLEIKNIMQDNGHLFFNSL